MRFGDTKRGVPRRGAYKVAPLDATERDNRCVGLGCSDAPAAHVDQLDVRAADWPEHFTCCWRHLHEFLADFRRAVDAGQRT